MGAAKDWGVPLLAAVVTFAALAQLDLPKKEAEPHAGDGAATRDPDPAPGRFHWVFPNPRVAEPRDVTAILLAEDPQPAAGAWRTPYVALVPLPAPPAHRDCVGEDGFKLCPDTVLLAPVSEPRLGRHGYNATRVTMHVFDADGELVFSNGDEDEQRRLSRKHAPEQLPDDVWYLGANETPPEGARRLPGAAASFLGSVFPLIDGLPVGGVASTETDALRTWYGTLYVTLRVDELVQAP